MVYDTECMIWLYDRDCMVQTLSYRAPHANYENQKMLINDRINEQATPSALKLDSKVS